MLFKILLVLFSDVFARSVFADIINETLFLLFVGDLKPIADIILHLPLCHNKPPHSVSGG